MSFVNIEVKTTGAEAVSEGLERLEALMAQKGYIGWEAQSASVLTIAMEALGPLWSDVAQIASALPEAAFEAFGTQLEGVPFKRGSRASASTLWTILPEDGELTAHTIKQGTQLAIGNFGFYVEQPVEIKAGESTAKVHVVAVEEGDEYNKITGTAELVEAINWVGEVTLEGETVGGTEPESTEEYLNRLVARQAIRAEVPITASNYATFARNVPEGVLPANIEVGRATSIEGYDPTTATLTATTTDGSTTLSEVSSFTGITVGTELEGPSIPEGTTVEEVNKGESKLVMSVAATQASTKATIHAIGSYEQERYVCTFVTDKAGLPLEEQGTAALEALEGWLAEHREIGFRTPVRAPSYNPIYVTLKVHVLPNYEAAAVASSVEAAVRAFLSPETWANPTHAETGSSAWLNREQGFNVVRYNQVLGVAESVQGVAYVLSAEKSGLLIGKSAESLGTSDVVMIGPAPLPKAETITVTQG